MSSSGMDTVRSEWNSQNFGASSHVDFVVNIDLELSQVTNCSENSLQFFKNITLVALIATSIFESMIFPYNQGPGGKF